MTTFSVQNDYRELCCSECGVLYFFPERWCDKARQRGKGWKCPNGHGQWFGEGENDKLRRRAERAEQENARLQDEIDAEIRRAAAVKAQLTKHKKRSAAGTCPCCKRTFQNMARHMKNQHPDFVAEQTY